MDSAKVRSALLVALGCVVLTASGCASMWSARERSSQAAAFAVPPATALAVDDTARERSLRFLEDKVRRDPEDFGAHNKLASHYLQLLHETGNVQYLDLAARAARTSLASVPEVRNTGGLSARTLVEFSSHDFSAARDHALQLTQLDPAKSYPYAMLGDALLELGDYEKATAAYRQMERRGGGIDENTESRQARLAQLHGDDTGAARHFARALALALNLPVPPHEFVAWCRWQIGETAFAAGDYETAEKHYRDALITFPNYYRALASLGRVRAARGDLPGAVEHFEQVVRRLPDPAFVAALGDLYKLAGRDREAAAQYAVVEQIGHLSVLNGALYNRSLALFYADHDMKAEEAYASARREYEMRRDIYGADAVAWTALKAGRISEAQAAIKEALRLGTRDARLFYHAGMIARAAGDAAAAGDFLQRALKLNPQFDPLQAQRARQALAH
ncbi:MAG: tetratricopeptide repeat protein [Pyrinomonadaceae bacterium]